MREEAEERSVSLCYQKTLHTVWSAMLMAFFKLWNI